ncbi:MAG: threonine--tRNA ligase [Candidatus Ryanbacteria bacterium RIFCSPHIGHO2_12_FULL_47_12b]|uniref:Threonine--tRNA ligase n=1 Tax=Candidatus Ryanbacteria bacterium RIFCSPLOWO2_02_FULL_47_14 TaxID=1802129 RepID=A0A1G2GZ27_9BACT|nr:MAG: Threonine-tRNA ligase [Parcubacteria group bacterium GW2011_GWA2_47_10b]KKU86253.1 MAG: Threonine-tRNA ligase [Parcubacteria group bacterium GW2011_GWA1_47_9]OGZ47831.1 MAG: threonine--tRNA ligase [Candidatus Ryanbacteria bacterium RIFCSPHIGHO2_02_FULL_47_25]OGZ53215.1 MAG: threonine--tRNA ligase [Candidatus Ryanbacteria bacterium RIFCSPHIGHO2_12_FULL_47_12b]OGZ55008.1 MAG: threonine--tRNA ligase [Candidatus Ryanbacteria bacterium RIFCSPLOWO2_02_FULL_47_14]
MKNKNGKLSLVDQKRHTLAHVLAMAVLSKYPDARLGIGPTIENGFYYDFDVGKPFKEEELAEFEDAMRDIVAHKLDITGKKITLADAKKLFKDQPFKIELAEEYAREDKELTTYMTGDFTDLCRGGHIANMREIDPKSFQLTRIAGAYWRGSEKNPQLQRIYGIAFDTKKELADHLAMLEEAKKRDHRVLGERLKLFTFAPEIGPGLPLWLPNGTIIREEIEKYAKKIEDEQGYKRIITPHIAKEELFRMSGHIPYYAENMYPPMELDDGNYYLKAMNCPMTHMIYKSEPHSYRELPIRYAEYGTVYRYELSGTLAGLLRTRGFTQNDAHIYCREDQVEEEFLNVMKLHEFWYKEVFDITDFYMRLSLPVEDKTKYAGAPEGWQKAVTLVRNAMRRSGLPYKEVEGEAAFYGPKVDFQIKSVIGREETASTNQLDFLAAERFGLIYKDSDGKEKPAYVIHRAPLGSHERFIAFLIEHFGGAFPFWLAPVQVRVLTINEKIVEYTQNVVTRLKKQNIRAELDQRNESINKKIREAELQKIPYIFVIGDKEAAAGTVNIRTRGEKETKTISLEEFLIQIEKESAR